MLIAYYAIFISILLLTLPLASYNYAGSSNADSRDYSPLNNMSQTGRKVAIFGGVLIAAVLIVLCINKPEGIADREMYQMMFDMGGADNLNRDLEPSFGLLVQIAPTFLALLGIYAFLSVSSHVIGIFKNSPNIWLSLVTYISYTFILHDMIQMRAGVAIGLMLIAVRFIYERKWILYFSFAAIATYFHYSAMVFFFFYFLPGKYLNRWIWSAALILATVFGLMNTQIGFIAKFIPLEIVQNYLENYVGNKTYEAAMIGPARIFKVLCAILMLFNQNTIKKRYPLCIPVLIFFMTSQISYLLFSDIPVLQGRFGEMFAAFDIFALAMFPLISKKYYYLLFIVPIGLAIYQNISALDLLLTDVR